MTTIPIQTTTRKYSYLLDAAHLESSLGALINMETDPVYTLIDDNVQYYWNQRLEKLFARIPNLSLHVIPHGERSKSIVTTLAIYKELIEKKLGRNTTVLSIGGGMVGDIAGFIASTYCRGVKLIHIPTTLLAMVDSSIGGKNGVNFGGIKNNIGTVYQPDAIIADIDFLSTLPKKELFSGYGEVIKYAYLGSDDMFNTIRSFLKKPALDHPLLFPIIEESVKIKSAVIKEDEFDTGERKKLNLGHSFAHAIESSSKFKITHGPAVAFGVAASLYLSEELGLIDQSKLNDLLILLPRHREAKVFAQLNPAEIISFMQYDKKSLNAEPRFVLVKGIGDVLFDIPAPKEKVESAIQSAKRLYIETYKIALEKI